MTGETVALAGRQPVSAALPVPTLGLGRASGSGTIVGRVGDAFLVLLGALLFPLGILLIGTPVVLCVRILYEIARRL